MANKVPPIPPPSQVPAQPGTVNYVRPSFMQMVFHVGRTSRLAGALLRDRRISIFRKFFFLLAIAGLILALLLPETIGVLVENILPFVGPVLGLPGDVALDWVAATVIGFNLLRIFPAEVVGEHYDMLFRVPVPNSQSR